MTADTRKFAAYEPRSGQVYGWFDMADGHAALPPDVLELTEEQWAARMENPSGFAVHDGALVPYTPPQPKRAPADKARIAISQGVVVVIGGREVKLSLGTEARLARTEQFIVADSGTVALETVDSGTVELPAAAFRRVYTATVRYHQACRRIIATNKGNVPPSPLEP